MKTKSLLLVFFAAFFTTASLAQHQQGHSLDWVPVQTIQSPYTIPGGYNTNGFGNSVDIDGDIAVSGDHTLNSVIVYKREGTVWVQKQELTGVPKSDFGEEVIILNNQIIISSPSEPMPNQNFGSVYVYNLNRQTGISSFSQKIQCNSSNYTYFGESLASENNILIIGSRGDSYNSYTFCGAAYICTLSNGLWSSPVRINHPNPHNGDSFGTKVGVSGNKIAVSAPNNNFGAYSDAGVVYIFTITYKSFKISINPTNIITSPNPSSEAHFGSSMVLKNSSLMIGQPANNYIYHYNANDWKLLQTLYESISGSEFGTGFDFNDQFLVIGSPYFNSHKGKISIYSWQQDEWQKTQNENPECFNLSTTWFGSCIAISDDYFVVGAPRVENLKSNEVSQSSINTTSSYVTLIEFYHKEPGLTADAGEDQTSCSLQAITLGGNPTASLGNPDYSYYWHDNNGWSSTEANPKVAPNQSTTYYLKVTDCNGNGNSVYDTVEITIGCKLPVDFKDARIDASIIDNEGNMYVSGENISHDQGPIFINDVPYYPITTVGYDRNMFIVKINAMGCVEWINTFATNTDDDRPIRNHKLALNSEGNISLLVGSNSNFLSTSFSVNYILPSVEFTWLAVFDKDGALLFDKVLPGKFNKRIELLCTNNGIFSLVYSSLNDKYYIYKYSNSGSYQWMHEFSVTNLTDVALAKINTNQILFAYTTNPSNNLTQINYVVIGQNSGLMETSYSQIWEDTWTKLLNMNFLNDNRICAVFERLKDYQGNAINLIDLGFLMYMPNNILNLFSFNDLYYVIYNQNNSQRKYDVKGYITNDEIIFPTEIISHGSWYEDYFQNFVAVDTNEFNERIIEVPRFQNYNINISSSICDYYYFDFSVGGITSEYLNKVDLLSEDIGCDISDSKNQKKSLQSSNPSSIHDENNLVLLSPNPSHDRINISLLYPIHTKFEILSTEGITMMKGEKSNLSETSIDISNFKAGLYIVKFISPTGIITKKFIKQ